MPSVSIYKVYIDIFSKQTSINNKARCIGTPTINVYIVITISRIFAQGKLIYN